MLTVGASARSGRLELEAFTSASSTVSETIAVTDLALLAETDSDRQGGLSRTARRHRSVIRMHVELAAGGLQHGRLC